MKDNVEKLLLSKQVSNYRIYKDTGIAQSTLSDLLNGKTQIGNMKIDHIITLNEYYLNLKRNGVVN